MERYFQEARERIEEPAEGREGRRAGVPREIRINAPAAMEERAEKRIEAENEPEENNKKNRKEMKELLKAIRKGKKNSDALHELSSQLSHMEYTDIHGVLKVGFENVIAGLADDIHELAANNN